MHYESYNNRFGSNGIHEALEWSASDESVEEFMRDNVYNDIIQTEIKERNMLHWLQTLGLHSFEARHFENLDQDEGNAGGEDKKKRYSIILQQMDKARKKKMNPAADSEESPPPDGAAKVAKISE